MESERHELSRKISTFTGVSLFSAGMTLFIASVTGAITGVVRPVMSSTEIVEPVDESAVESHDREAQVLFAPAETVAPYTLETGAGNAIGRRLV